MPSTRDNGIQVPINADAYNLTGDLAILADTANVATVCVNAAAMDALSDSQGRLAIRVDLGYALYYNDGAGNWKPVPLATPFGHMGRTAGFMALSTTTATVVMDAAQELRGGMTFDNANDALVIPQSGLYTITMKLYTSGGSSGVKHTMTLTKLVGGAVSGVGIQIYKADTADWYGTTCMTVPLLANDKLYLSAAVVSGTSNTWGTDGYNGTFLEAEFKRP